MLPRVVIHNGVSADGRTDWFSGDVGLFYELAQRWDEDATLAGVDTLLAGTPPDAGDAPPIEPPRPDDRRPLLVTPDSRGRLHAWRYWLSQPYWRAGVALCSQATPQEHLDFLTTEGIAAIVAGTERVDLRAALEQLSERYGVETVRVDSGGTLNGVLLRAGLVDEVSVLVTPHLVGGTSQQGMYRAPDLVSESGVIPVRLLAAETLRDGHVWLRYEVVR